MTTVELPFQTIAELEAMPMTMVIAMVYAMFLAMTAAWQALESARGDHDTRFTRRRRGVLTAAYVQHVQIVALRRRADDHMMDRLYPMSEEDLFAEYNRVRQGHGDYDEHTRDYIVERYMSMLEHRAQGSDARVQGLIARAAENTAAFVDLPMVDMEALFWNRWSGFLIISNGAMPTAFGHARVQPILASLNTQRGHATENIARLARAAEHERLARLLYVLRLGMHPRVRATFIWAGLPRGLMQMIIDFALA